MYQHKLYILATELEPVPEFNDSVYKHVVYAYATATLKPDNTRDKSVATQDVVYLDTPDINNFIPSANVTKEILEQWVTNKINITELQNTNIAKLNK